MSQQHQRWIQLVKDKLNTEGMTQTHLARACGVKKPTISDLLKYGKGSNKLKNRVCDVLGIDETWVELGEQDMNEIFNFHGQEVRTVIFDNEPWFVAKDVADILGQQNGSRDINRHVDEDDKLTSQVATAGQMRNQIVINESGLYSLILSSKLPQAKEFKRWVTSEVLPAIRKQGGFIREDLDEDAFIALFTGQKKLREQQATMLEDIDYLKSEQPIHPSYAQSLLKKRKARVVACLGGIDSPVYADKTFAQSVFRQAEIDFKDHFNISRYDLLPKKHADAALAHWMTWEPSTNTKMKIMELNAFSQA